MATPRKPYPRPQSTYALLSKHLQAISDKWMPYEYSEANIALIQKEVEDLMKAHFYNADLIQIVVKADHENRALHLSFNPLA